VERPPGGAVRPGARRFYIFGLVLYPQDFIYLTALLIISAYALFLFTAVAGRLWCGYACPQTVYTEIFLWVERKFEGDRAARMKLDAGAAGARKLWRKAASRRPGSPSALWTGFTFVGYFTPIRTLAGRGVRFWPSGPGSGSGCCSTASPPTATPASCASRCASTCARTRASRARCSTRTR
jgi:polyferredoxin